MSDLDGLFTTEEEDALNTIIDVCFDSTFLYNKDKGMEIPTNFDDHFMDEVKFREAAAMVCYIEDDMLFFTEDILLRIEICIL